jgi:hypothetical protein
LTPKVCVAHEAGILRTTASRHLGGPGGGDSYGDLRMAGLLTPARSFVDKSSDGVRTHVVVEIVR